VFQKLWHISVLYYLGSSCDSVTVNVFTEGGGAKKKKKGSAYQTISATHRVRSQLHCDSVTFDWISPLVEIFGVAKIW